MEPLCTLLELATLVFKLQTEILTTHSAAQHLVRIYFPLGKSTTKALLRSSQTTNTTCIQPKILLQLLEELQPFCILQGSRSASGLYTVNLPLENSNTKCIAHSVSLVQNGNPKSQATSFLTSVKTREYSKWHSALNHIFSKRINILANGAVTGIHCKKPMEKCNY